MIVSYSIHRQSATASFFSQKKEILTFCVEFVQLDHEPSLLIRSKTISKFIVFRSQEHTNGGLLSCSSAVIDIDDKAERFVFQMMIFHLLRKKVLVNQLKINFSLMYYLQFINMIIIHKFVKNDFIFKVQGINNRQFQ